MRLLIGGKEEELYLPEVRHGGGKWALRGDVGGVPGVVVHLEERRGEKGEERSAWISTLCG